MWRVLAVASGFSLALGMVAQPASADGRLHGPYRLINLGTHKCLEVADWSTNSGAAVRQWDCTGGRNQQWYLNDLYSPSFPALVNLNSSKCVDRPGGAQDNGVQLIQWDCHWGSNQQWHLAYPDGVGPVTEFASGSYSMEIGGYSGANGAPAQLWRANGGDNQKWYVGS
ncbi:RICIN domain-containing protein [Kitasatospora sp. HPMI-4]|uniref:RICIN domain-containing protein n=1 Tax=Kitasatospora sp. HPMI-4 TaxID=3448443 RepID=UPI003F1BC587